MEPRVRAVGARARRGVGLASALMLVLLGHTLPAVAQVIELDDEPLPRKVVRKKVPTPKPRPHPPARKPLPHPVATPKPAQGPQRGVPAIRQAPEPSRAVHAPEPTEPSVESEPKTTEDVEVFESPASPDAAPAAAIASGALTEEERFEASGWVRLRASLFDANDHRLPADPTIALLTGDTLSDVLPYDRVTGDVQGYLRARYRKGKRWEAVVAASVSGAAYVNAEPSPSAFAGPSGSQPRTEFEPVVREAWAGSYRTALDFRVGLQRIAWGKGDAVTPNDVVNARDLREPFLAESALQRLPTLAVRADVPLGAGATLQLHVAPFFTPDTVDIWGSNAAVVQPSAPAAFRLLMNRVGKVADPTLRSEFLALVGQSRRPRYDLTEGSGGAKLGSEAGGFDGAFYGHYGFHPQPYLRVSGDLPVALVGVDLNSVGAMARPFIDAIARGEPLILSTYVRRVHAGFDVARAVGPFVVKLEGAFATNLPVLFADLSGTLAPVATGVLGLEWQPGEGATFVLAETAVQHLADLPGGRRLLVGRETTLTQALLVRHAFFEHLQFELRGAGALEPRGLMFRPQIAWNEATWDVRAGVVWLGGDEGSYAAYYERNTQGYLVLRGKL